jgi:hypothetical protein
MLLGPFCSTVNYMSWFPWLHHPTSYFKPAMPVLVYFGTHIRSTCNFSLLSKVFEIGLVFSFLGNRDNSVSTASGYGLDDQAMGFDPRQRQSIFPLACVHTGSESHPASCTMGTGGPFPEATARPGRGADHSPPSSAEVKNE